MSLLTPFFEDRAPTQSNLGKVITSVVSSLGDDEVLDWANSMDWSEPVLSVRRFGRQEIGGWIDAELVHESLMEVVVSTGDERLVRLLLDPSRFPESIRWNGVQLKDSEYRSVGIEMQLVNAAIGAKSQATLERVLDVVIDERTLVHHWSNGSRFSPAVCLASHRNMPAGDALKMASAIEKRLVERVEKQWGRSTSNHFRRKWRSDLLSHCCRLGNVSLASALLQKHRLGLTFSLWDDLLHSGHIQWCCDWAMGKSAWGKTQEEARSGWTSREEPEYPAVSLVKAATEQFTKAAETFSGDPLKKVRKQAMANLDYVLDAIMQPTAQSGLLGNTREVASSVIAPMLINHDDKKALAWLAAHRVPLSIEEVAAWLVHGHGPAVLMQRASNGCIPLAAAEASDYIKKALKEDLDPSLSGLSWAVQSWGMEEFVKDWPLSSSEKAEVMAGVLSVATPPSNAPRSVRRM